MSVEVELHEQIEPATRACSYCNGSTGCLVDDGEGGLMHADGEGCAEVTVRVAGITLPAAALDAPLPVPSRARQVDDLVALVLSGEEIDPSGETERMQQDVSAALRIEASRAHRRVIEAMRALPDHARRGGLRAVDEVSARARATLAHVLRWERARITARSVAEVARRSRRGRA